MIKSQLAARMGDWQAANNKTLSIPELADVTGISKDFLYRFHNDEVRRLDLDKLEQLCQFFHCTPDALLWVPNDIPPVDFAAE